MSEHAKETMAWKSNWDETRENFRNWWKRDGLIISGGFGRTGGTRPAREGVLPLASKATLKERYTDSRYFAEDMHYQMAIAEFSLDTPPITPTNLGPGNFATYLGSEPGFAPDTIWFYPIWQDILEPENCTQLRFDPDNYWWRKTKEIIEHSVALGSGKYLTGCPDLVENIDVLASLRDAQTLLMDMIERPSWVEDKVAELNQIWFDVYDRIYEIIKLPDGSSAFWAFGLWGDGKTAKVQCDASAMFSPDMFKRFVVPSLTEQCDWLDNSLYHLDGSQCLQHLDLLLEIDSLDAIEWTPDPLSPSGGDSTWHEMYKRIVDAGKSVQVLGVEEDELKPLLDTVGTAGVYAMVSLNDEAQVERVAAILEEYR